MAWKLMHEICIETDIDMPSTVAAFVVFFLSTV